MLVANAFPGNVTTEFVQFQRDREPFFAGHLTVTQNLFFQACLWRHVPTLPRRAPPVNDGKLRAVRQVAESRANYRRKRG